MEGSDRGNIKDNMITFYRKYQSDFWWLTTDELKKFNYIHVCYQEPYSDEPRSNRTPTSVCRYFSLDNNNNLSSEIKYYKLSYLDSWKKRFNNTNVFRSIYLFSYPCQENKDSICGPIILDIDREKPSDKGYAYDL